MQLTAVKKLTSNPALPVHQIERVVAADRVNTTAVYSRAGVALGTVDRLMIDKISAVGSPTPSLRLAAATAIKHCPGAC